MRFGGQLCEYVASTHKLAPIQITNDLPSKILELGLQEQKAMEKKAVAEKRNGHAKAVKACSTAATAIVGGIAIVAFPPALLLLPILLPVVILASEAIEWRNNKQIKSKCILCFAPFTLLRNFVEREIECRDCREAIRELGNATQSLAKIGHGVDQFANYWLSLHVMLEDLSGRLVDLRGKRAYRMRLHAILSTWKELRDMYKNYAANVCIS